MGVKGQPTPPIAFGAPPAEVGTRLPAAAIAVDDELLTRLRSACADLTVDAAALAEASRDWWPLAMIWALDGEVPARAAAMVRPASAGEVAAVLAACNEARVPVTAAAGRSGVCGGSVPVFGGVCLDLSRLAGIEAFDDGSLLVDVAPGTSRDHFEAELQAEHDITL